MEKSHFIGETRARQQRDLVLDPKKSEFRRATLEMCSKSMFIAKCRKSVTARYFPVFFLYSWYQYGSFVKISAKNLFRTGLGNFL